MSKKTSSKPPKSTDKAQTPKLAVPRRRTRMIALEPRMLFDGALGLDLGTKATAIMLGDSSAHVGDATVAPATPESQKDTSAAAATVPAKPAVAADTDTAQKPGGEAPSSGPAAIERKEIVFVDARVKDYQSMMAGVDPKAAVIFLDGSKDGVTQIADALTQYSDVSAIHI